MKIGVLPAPTFTFLRRFSRYPTLSPVIPSNVGIRGWLQRRLASTCTAEAFQISLGIQRLPVVLGLPQRFGEGVDDGVQCLVT